MDIETVIELFIGVYHTLVILTCLGVSAGHKNHALGRFQGSVWGVRIVQDCPMLDLWWTIGGKCFFLEHPVKNILTKVF